MGEARDAGAADPPAVARRGAGPVGDRDGAPGPDGGGDGEDGDLALSRGELIDVLSQRRAGGNQDRQVRLPVDLPSNAGSVEVSFTPGD